MSDSDRALDEYFDHARREVFPKIRESGFSLIIAGDPDPKLCMELGACILFDKPIVLLVPKGRNIPLNLRTIAMEIVELDEAHPAASYPALTAALERVRKTLDFRGSVAS